MDGLDITVLFFPVNNDITVTAQFPEITDGTGMTAQFWYKDDRYTPDSDPSTNMYQNSIIKDNQGNWFSTFNIPGTANKIAGSFWWRVDAVDAQSKRRTAANGPVLVQAS